MEWVSHSLEEMQFAWLMYWCCVVWMACCKLDHLVVRGNLFIPESYWWSSLLHLPFRQDKMENEVLLKVQI